MSAAVRVPTQRERVLDLLRRGPQSTLDLRAHYVMCPSRIVCELKAAGHAIVNTPTTKHVAVYTLVQAATA